MQRLKSGKKSGKPESMIPRSQGKRMLILFVPVAEEGGADRDLGLGKFPVLSRLR